MNSSRLFLCICIGILLFSCNQNTSTPAAQETSSNQIPHLEKQGTATRLVVDGKPFLMLAGELHNSTAGGFEYMRPVWKRMADKT